MITVAVRTARKEHHCEDCRWRSIAPGHRYELHTVFPGHDIAPTDKPMALKRCMACAIDADVIAAHTGEACGTYCCGVTPCARPFGHVGDCSCREDARAGHRARLAAQNDTEDQR